MIIKAKTKRTHLVWASDQEEARVELLQENNALATVDTSEEDEDGTLKKLEFRA